MSKHEEWEAEAAHKIERAVERMHTATGVHAFELVLRDLIGATSLLQRVIGARHALDDRGPVPYAKSSGIDRAALVAHAEQVLAEQGPMRFVSLVEAMELTDTEAGVLSNALDQELCETVQKFKRRTKPRVAVGLVGDPRWSDFFTANGPFPIGDRAR